MITIAITLTLDPATDDPQIENEALDGIRKAVRNIGEWGPVGASAETELNGTLDLKVWADTPFGRILPGGPEE